MKTEVIKISQIKSNPNNPRLIKDDKFRKLVKSVQEFPEMLQIRPIVVNEDMIVLGGNMRLKACIEAGLKEVPIIKASELTPDQQRQFIIKDNISGGEWDWDMLANEWDAQELNDWGLDIPDLKPIEAEAVEDDYEIPDKIKTDIVLGDLFEIGPHRLLCGDSTQTDTFAKLFDGQMADLVVTDPPYNVAYEGKTKEKLTIQNDSMSDNDFYQFLYDFYTALGTYTKAGGAWYVWHADSEGANFRKAMSDAGIMVKQCLIWVKNSMALIAYQIGNSSKQGDIVADGFGGSGTTMVAAHQLNRRGYLVEYDPKYCQVIVDRMLKLDPSLEVKRNGKPYTKT